jgi:hypothetical protein
MERATEFLRNSIAMLSQMASVGMLELEKLVGEAAVLCPAET